MQEQELMNKTCIPCMSDIPPMPVEERKKYLMQLSDGWELTHNNNRLFKKTLFYDFKTPFDLVTQIGVLAEEQGHHPEIFFGFGHLDLEIWTHKIDSLLESDFILAAKIDRLMLKQ